MNAVTLKGSYLLNSFMFAAGLAALTAVGCGDDGTGQLPTGMGGSAAPVAGTGTAGTPAGTAGTPAGTAGTPSGTAGMPSGTAGTPTGAAGMGAGGAPSGGTATLTEIYSMIYVNKCAICHAMAPSDSANGKLGGIKDKNAFHAAVVGKPAQGAMCVGKGTYVVPMQPQMSLLMQKLDATVPCGVQMPVGNMLEESEIKMLTSWIAAGAPNN